MQIRKAFETLPEDQLFIVPAEGQVDNDMLFGDGADAVPVYNMQMTKVYDRQSAINAIDESNDQLLNSNSSYDGSNRS